MSSSNPLAKVDPLGDKVFDYNSPTTNALTNPIRKDEYGLPVGPGTFSPGDYAARKDGAQWGESPDVTEQRRMSREDLARQERFRGYWGTPQPFQRPSYNGIGGFPNFQGPFTRQAMSLFYPQNQFFQQPYQSPYPGNFNRGFLQDQNRYFAGGPGGFNERTGLNPINRYPAPFNSGASYFAGGSNSFDERIGAAPISRNNFFRAY